MLSLAWGFLYSLPGLWLLRVLLQDEAFGDFVARVGFAALRQYTQGYVPADKEPLLPTVSE